MAIDQNLSPASPEAVPGSAIENEIPAYRAISAQAVFSLIFGVLAILTFAEISFVVCAAAAVVLGVLAERKIQRFPDMLTGRRLAHAGITLGLICGLSSVTITTTQSIMRSTAATRFAKKYVDILRSGPIEEAFWYKQHPSRRKTKSPSEMFTEMKAGLRDPRMLDMELGPLKQIKARLAAAPGEEIRFVRLEAHGVEGMEDYGAALVELRGPGSKDFPFTQQFALLVVKAHTEHGKKEWWVENIQFPYTPATYVPTPKPVDDGHGHSH